MVPAASPRHLPANDTHPPKRGEIREAPECSMFPAITRKDGSAAP